MIDSPSTSFRGLHPISGAGEIEPVRGALPAYELVPLGDLVINEAYQRGLTERGRKLIRRIAEKFDWAKFKALSCMALADGRREIRDGQHGAMAAATRGDIPALPALVMPCVDTNESADAFVGLNTARVGLTPTALFAASLTSRDPVCLAVVEGANKAGASLRSRATSAQNPYQAGETVAYVALTALAKARGAEGVEKVLRLGVRCGLTPISSDFIKAAASLMWDREYEGSVDFDLLAEIVGAQDWSDIERAARDSAKQIKQPYGRVLVGMLYRMVA